MDRETKENIRWIIKQLMRILTYGDAISTLPKGMKRESLDEVAPPGMEHVVKALKKKFPGDKARAFKIAWAMYNKKESQENHKTLRSIIPEVKMNFGWDKPDKSSLAHRKDGKLRTLKGYERAVAASKKRERSDEKDNAERGGTEYGTLFRRD